MRKAGSLLAARADDLAASARKAFAGQGQYGTTAHLWVQGFPILLALPTDEGGKQALRALIEVAARGGAEACAVVSECWMAGGDPESFAEAVRWREGGRSLGEIPGRQEVLMIAVASPAGIERREFEIRRDGGKARLRRQDPREPYFNRFLSDLPWPAASPGREGRRSRGASTTRPRRRPRAGR